MDIRFHQKLRKVTQVGLSQNTTPPEINSSPVKIGHHKRKLSHEKKKTPTFRYTGWLVGIIIMVYYNPYVIG